MDILLTFGLFIGAMVACIFANLPMIFPLIIGLFLFICAGIYRGYTLNELIRAAYLSGRDAKLVAEVMLIIGVLTGLWRASGTITFFVYYGTSIIKDNLFLIVTFILVSILSYALGTSFGVTGTMGVIFMALARSGGVDPYITAGIIMSAVYFGDRTSPASSSANLVASITNTNLYDNLYLMLKTSVIPMAICIVIYGYFSYLNPISHIDTNVIKAIEKNFIISPLLIIPAIIMIVFPLMRIDVRISMLASIGACIILGIFIQGYSFFEVIKFGIMGYYNADSKVGYIMNGGGAITMIEICGIVFISCSYSGIFNKTKMLYIITAELEKLSTWIGKFPVMVLLSLFMAMVFCNQTIASIMCNDLMKDIYVKSNSSNIELAQDIENSIILLAGIVPWCIACSVPLAMMGVGRESLVYSCFIYLMPLTYGISKRYFFK